MWKSLPTDERTRSLWVQKSSLHTRRLQAWKSLPRDQILCRSIPWLHHCHLPRYLPYLPCGDLTPRYLRCACVSSLGVLGETFIPCLPCIPTFILCLPCIPTFIPCLPCIPTFILCLPCIPTFIRCLPCIPNVT